MRHGTEQSYRREKCRCAECRAYRRDRQRDARERRKAQVSADPSLITHGTGTAYENWKCRCLVCRIAYSKLRYVRLDSIPWTGTVNE